MNKKYLTYVILCFLTLFSYFTFAQSTSNQALSPVGLWETFDEATGKPTSLIRIKERNGELIAVIVKDLLPAAASDEVCDKCDGNLKDKPIIGMTIMDGMKQHGDDYEGGHILDPENGETYRCKLKLDATGNKLEVRGFIGVSLLGRSQTWTREQ
jgi:uncharacterized protein (DUF2147 family)